jgi:hypothetical protein
MKLWYLMRTDDVDYEEDSALMVRATSANAARKIAAAESHKSFGDACASTCERVTEQGEACILIADNRGS